MEPQLAQQQNVPPGFASYDLRPGKVLFSFRYKMADMRLTYTYQGFKKHRIYGSFSLSIAESKNEVLDSLPQISSYYDIVLPTHFVLAAIGAWHPLLDTTTSASVNTCG